MNTNLYYNPSSATADTRTGHGYGKAQKIPSLGTGLGSETIMGSSSSGIYTDPDIEPEEDEEEDYGFKDSSDIDAFVRKVNLKHVDPGPSFWPRADRSSFAGSGNRFDLGTLGMSETSLPKVRKGIAPFSNKTLYPKGFSGPPLGSGNAGQAFRTTGMLRRTGTQYGSSRAPITSFEEDDIGHMSFLDVLDLSNDERSIIRQRIKIMRILNKLDEIDDEFEFTSPA